MPRTETRLFRVPVQVTFEVLVSATDDIDADRDAALTAVKEIHDRIRQVAPYEMRIITGCVPALELRYIDYDRPEEM